MQIANLLNSSELTFPILECFHIAGFIIAIGTTAIVDFRILGYGLLGQTPSQLMKSTRFWTLGGLLVAIFTGLGLYSSDPDTYYLNLSFLFKIACLILAIILNYTIHGKVAKADSTSGGAKVVACISLALWGAVIFGGIFIAFVQGGL
ncbi:MAG TPA: hypothetical protein VGR73_16735 [Bryobacteraceae bacterium]|nr:hypothetical protein [Bryobacteraceae bacterium]